MKVKINNRTADVEMIQQSGNLIEIRVDEKNYNIDLMHNSEGAFSIIEGGHSFDIEIISTIPKKYTAYTLYNTYNLEVLDAESLYLINRGTGGLDLNENTIYSPMPGKVVKILFSEGDVIKKGETAIIISAMKMESEYKSPRDGIVNKIFVAEGDTIEGNQVLIEVV
jgi:biotin carboxyl carrier protein